MRQGLVVFACVGAIVASMAGAAVGETVNPLAGAAAKQIFGPEFDLAKARGRVVFFEYWGIDCPPCRASYPHLVSMQKKYGPSGRFQVVTSHVQGMGENVMAFLKKENVPFPVFQQFRPASAAIRGFIPMAFLFDHTGKLVAEGSPTSLYPKVEALVRAAPNPLPDSPMIEGVDVQACRAQAMGLVPGKPAAAVCKQLEAKAKAGKADAAEAQALLDKAKGWMTAQTERLEKLSAEKPAASLEPLKLLAATTATMPEGAKPAELLAGLQKDPNVAALAKLVQLKAALTKAGDTPDAKRRTQAFKTQLAAFQKKPNLSPALAAEAAAMGDTPAPEAAAKPAEAVWLTSFPEAVKQAQAGNKLILADFTGSDWCGWCVRLKSEVFDTPAFKEWAGKNVVLLELDYPRGKAQPAELKAANAALMQKYGVRGFPTILFLKADGEVAGRSGYRQGGPEGWIASAQGILDGAKGN